MTVAEGLAEMKELLGRGLPPTAMPKVEAILMRFGAKLPTPPQFKVRQKVRVTGKRHGYPHASIWRGEEGVVEENPAIRVRFADGQWAMFDRSELELVKEEGA